MALHDRVVYHHTQDEHDVFPDRHCNDVVMTTMLVYCTRYCLIIPHHITRPEHVYSMDDDNDEAEVVTITTIYTVAEAATTGTATQITMVVIEIVAHTHDTRSGRNDTHIYTCYRGAANNDPYVVVIGDDVVIVVVRDMVTTFSVSSSSGTW